MEARVGYGQALLILAELVDRHRQLARRWQAGRAANEADEVAALGLGRRLDPAPEVRDCRRERGESAVLRVELELVDGQWLVGAADEQLELRGREEGERVAAEDLRG